MQQFTNLTGRRFGRLVVVKLAIRRSGRKRFWLCQCDCGTRVEVRSDQLTRGVAKSCGCLQREIAGKLGRQRVSQETLNLRRVRARREAKGLPPNLGIRDLTGRRFGRLKVIEFVRVHDQQSFWRCECSCGNTTVVTAARLNYGWTTSCGCWQREAPERSHKNLKHGLYRSPEYLAYHAMKQRCYNPNYHHFENWGGRGITICQRWIDSFEAFYADMGPKPSPQHSLDRKNNNGNYNKRNCRWSLAKPQANNRRR